MAPSVLTFLGGSKEWKGLWFDFLAVASDPANNVTVNLERCF